jgi:hypothetical protein
MLIFFSAVESVFIENVNFDLKRVKFAGAAKIDFGQ